MVAEKYDPQIQRILDNPGVYILHDPVMKPAVVPVFSANGQIHSMQLDEVLSPSGLKPGIDIEGPVQPMSDRVDRCMFQERIKALRSLLAKIREQGLTTENRESILYELSIGENP
jgi:hypothetical protein